MKKVQDQDLERVINEALNYFEEKLFRGSIFKNEFQDALLDKEVYQSNMRKAKDHLMRASLGILMLHGIESEPTKPKEGVK